MRIVRWGVDLLWLFAFGSVCFDVNGMARDYCRSILMILSSFSY